MKSLCNELIQIYIKVNQSTMENNWNQYFFNFITRNKDKPWNWNDLSRNSNVTWEIVEANLDKPWDWDYLSENPNVTWEIVKENLDKPWSWNGLSRNPNITSEIVEANLDKTWDWFALSRNKFTKEKEEFEKKVLHQKFIQENILEELVKAYMHPKRIVMLLDMGYEIEELDDIM